MPYAKKSTSRRPVKRTRPYKRRARALVGKNVKAYVQRTLSRNIETKQVTYKLIPTYFNSAIGATTELFQLIPPISVGPGQTGRVGEETHPQKIVVSGYVNYAGNSESSANEIIARLFCFQDKSVKSWDLRSNISLSLLDTGGTGSTFTGALLDTVVPHNNDHFTFFKDSRHSFLKPYGLTNNNGATTAITSMNRSMVWFFKLTLTKKHLPHVFKYDGSDYPTNFCPVMGLGYAYAQNDSPDTLSTKVLMAYSSTLYYKDA